MSYPSVNDCYSFSMIPYKTIGWQYLAITLVWLWIRNSHRGKSLLNLCHVAQRLRPEAFPNRVKSFSFLPESVVHNLSVTRFLWFPVTFLVSGFLCPPAPGKTWRRSGWVLPQDPESFLLQKLKMTSCWPLEWDSETAVLLVALFLQLLLPLRLVWRIPRKLLAFLPETRRPRVNESDWRRRFGVLYL